MSQRTEDFLTANFFTSVVMIQVMLDYVSNYELLLEVRIIALKALERIVSLRIMDPWDVSSK